MIRALRLSLCTLLLSTLVAVPALAGHRSKLVITVDRPIAVLVDGEMLEFMEGTTSVEKVNIDPGRHIIEFRNFGGKLVGEGEVRVPTEGAAIVRARWSNKTFEVIDTVFLEPERETVIVERHTTIIEPGDHVTVSASAGGFGVSAGVSSYGGSASVSASTSIGGSVRVTETHGTTVREEVVVERVEARRGSRMVTLRAADDESVNVWIDGKRVWAYHVGTPEKTVEVTAGEHRIELKNFMEDTVWCKGQLHVSGDQDLTVGVSERGCVEVYNDPGAFSRR